MPRYVAYTIAGLPGLSVEAQEAALFRHWSEQFRPLGFTLAPVHHDGAESLPLRFGSRPFGFRLFLLADTGDVIVFPDLRVVGPRITDMVSAINAPLCRGIRVIVLNQGIDTATAEVTLRALADFERTVRSERVRGAVAKKRAAGKMVNGSAPPGWKVVGRAGARKMVQCPFELPTVDRIRRWNDEGLSLDEIHLRLLSEGARRRNGEEWSRTTIWRLLEDNRAGRSPA
jgi:hypothetical protein